MTSRSHHQVTFPQFSREELAVEFQDPRLEKALLENQAVRSQIAAQTHLMQLMTHQLATPITSLNGSLGLLEEATLSHEMRQEFLQVVQQEVDRLQALLQDLKALRNFDTGNLELQVVSFDLPALVTEVMQGFETCPVTYHLEASLPQVRGDRWQIAQVLINLISNAIKYSPVNREIEIGATQINSAWVEVWVRDWGLGIPAADQPHVFERFYRVKHRDRQDIHGTGLGLSLCKQLVENQGGKLNLESTHGEGSRFFFTLPVIQ
jgi:signal transduction histidine kinase